MKNLTISLLLLLTGMGANATVYTSVMDGDYDTAATWGGSGFPNSSDDVFISHAVTTDGSEKAHDVTIVGSGSLTLGSGTFKAYGSLTVSTGTFVDITTKRLKIRGNVVNNGVIGGTGNGRLYFNTINDSELSGNGVFNVPGNIYVNDNLNILASANLVFTQGVFRIARPVTNHGNLTLFEFRGTGSNDGWTNAEGSSLIIMSTITGTLPFNATAEDNSVEYGALGSTSQNIITPVSGRYFNLIISGDDHASVKTLTGNINVLADLEIGESTLSAGTTTYYDINLKGNWYNDEGIFLAGQGFVSFNGDDDQELDNGNGTETFYDLYFGGAETLILTSDLIVNRHLSIEKAFDTGGQAITVGGNWNTNQVLDLNGSIVTFNSNVSTIITGDMEFSDLTINKTVGGTVTIGLGTNVSITGSLEIPSGTLNTNGTLTVVSNAMGTGRIGDLSNGAVVGDVTVQRFSDNSLNGWHLMCSPVQGRTLSDWNDDFITTGFIGSDYPGFDFNSATRYNETISGAAKDDGLVNAINDGESISGLTGWRMYVAAGVTNIDVKGALFTGAQTLPLTYTDNGAPLEDGWNLVSNPYASAIDWDAATGWTKSGVNNAIYVWNPVNEQYTTYVGGVGTNGGSRFVPSTQAFWVQTSAAGPSLTINEPTKVDNAMMFRSNEVRNDFFSVAITNEAGVSNEVAIRIDEKATNEFDGALDALFFASSNPSIPSLCVKDPSDIAYSIYSINKLEMETTIPLYVKVGISQQYDFTFDNANNFGEASCLKLVDTETNEVVAITDGLNYSVFLETGEYNDRFVLKLSTPVNTNVINETCARNNNKIEVNVPAGETWNVSAYDNDNVSVFNQVSTGGELTSEPLAPGVYSVEITSTSGQCQEENFTVEVPVTQNPVVTFRSVEATNGNVDGSIFTSVTGALAPYSYEWSTGTSAKDLVNVAAGTYYLTVTDSRMCSYSTNVVLNAGLNSDYKSIVNDNVTVKYSSGDVVIDFNLESKQNYQLNVYNSIGQIVYAGMVDEVQFDSRRISIADITGMALIVLENTNSHEVIVKRIAF